VLASSGGFMHFASALFASKSLEARFQHRVIDLRTPDEMRKIIPAEIAKWTKVAIDARMPRTDQ
jgi:hypothetical protein